MKCLLVVTVLAGCGSSPKTKEAPATPEPTGAPVADVEPAGGSWRDEPIGVLSCDRYLASMAKCMEVFPEEARAAIDESMNQIVAAWRAVDDREVLSAGCAEALKASAASMNEMCPEVVWQ